MIIYLIIFFIVYLFEIIYLLDYKIYVICIFWMYKLSPSSKMRAFYMLINLHVVKRILFSIIEF